MTTTLREELMREAREAIEGQARLARAFASLEQAVLKAKAQRDEAIEIVTQLAETLPKSCNCDGASDGSGLCLPHRAERLAAEHWAPSKETVDVR